MDKPVVRDAALLIFRATLGLIFVAHGWQKLFMDGPVETAGKLSAAGIPQAKLSAYIVGGGELLGGALLVVGLLTTLAAGA
ncbi:DoxX family membrane protein, partial [Corynebacterium durum]